MRWDQLMRADAKVLVDTAHEEGNRRAAGGSCPVHTAPGTGDEDYFHSDDDGTTSVGAQRGVLDSVIECSTCGHESYGYHVVELLVQGWRWIPLKVEAKRWRDRRYLLVCGDCMSLSS